MSGNHDAYSEQATNSSQNEEDPKPKNAPVEPDIILDLLTLVTGKSTGSLIQVLTFTDLTGNLSGISAIFQVPLHNGVQPRDQALLVDILDRARAQAGRDKALFLFAGKLDLGEADFAGREG